MTTATTTTTVTTVTNSENGDNSHKSHNGDNGDNSNTGNNSDISVIGDKAGYRLSLKAGYRLSLKKHVFRTDKSLMRAIRVGTCLPPVWFTIRRIPTEVPYPTMFVVEGDKRQLSVIQFGRSSQV